MSSTKLRKVRLKKSRLYLVLDRKITRKKSVASIIKKIQGNGIDIIQLRDKAAKKEDILKDAFALKKLLKDNRALVIINDYLDVAKISDSDGVHLGQQDASIEIARRILGKDKIIGVSCHSLKQALSAQRRGADYLGIGPIFPTPTKPETKPVGLELIKKIKRKIKIPFFAIGGINQNNIGKVLAAGAKRVAVCRAILNDPVRIRKK